MLKPTMKDVAARAGVDVSTVSRAMHERTRGVLRSDTVERVLAAAEEIGYRPNALARSLRTQRSMVIGMVVPDVTNPFFPPILRGLEDALGDHGYTLVVVNTDNDAERERGALRSLVERRVDGLLLSTSHGTYETTEPAVAALPVVLVNRMSEDAPVPAVAPDDARAVRDVVEHLHALGHRRLAHLAGPQWVSTGRARLAAFRDACLEIGLPTPAIEVADAFRLEQGQWACERLLRGHAPVTAVFAANDLMAIGALKALRAAGLHVPDDVSLVGFNDMPLVDLIEPALTTIHVPQYAMGRRAAELMLELLGDGEPDGDGQVVLTCELVVRASTARPPDV